MVVVVGARKRVGVSNRHAINTMGVNEEVASGIIHHEQQQKMQL